MQSVRNAKERALYQLAVARQEKEETELKTRTGIEAERDRLARMKLEGALNNRKDWESELGDERAFRQKLKSDMQSEKERAQANLFRQAEAIRQEKKNLKQSKFFNDQLKMLVARDDRASNTKKMTSDVDDKKTRVAKLEEMEHSMIQSLQTTMNELQSVINHSQAGKVNAEVFTQSQRRMGRIA